MNSVTFQTHEWEPYNELWNCEVLWHMASTQLSVVLLVVDKTVHTTHQNASFLGHISLIHLSSLTIASARHAASTVAGKVGISGHCLSSTSVLPLSKALHHIYMIHMQSTHIHQMAMNFHQCNTVYTQKWKCCILLTFDHFSNRPTTLNWLYM